MRRENAEDVYRLSPVQQGMLFHSLHTPGASMYRDPFETFDAATFELWNEIESRSHS